MFAITHFCHVVHNFAFWWAVFGFFFTFTEWGKIHNTRRELTYILKQMSSCEMYSCC